MSLTKSPALVYGAAPRVNLLPPAEREQRERSDLTRRWARIAVAAVVVVVLVTIVTAFLESSARSGLDQERARTPALLEELSHYQDISAATRDKSAYETYRAAAMATDLSWKSLLDAMQAKVPAGSAITGFDAVVDPASAAADGAASATAGPTAGPTTPATKVAAPAGTAVTVTLTVTGRRPLAQQTLVAGLQKVPGVLGVDLGSLSSDSYPSYTAISTVYLDDSVYSERYAGTKP